MTEIQVAQPTAKRGEKVTKSNGVSVQWMTVIQLVAGICTPILIAMMGWIGNSVVTNSKDIAAIKAERYTQADAKSDREKMQSEVTEIRSLLHSLDKKIPEKAPPDWLEVELQKIRAELAQISARQNPCEIE